MAYSPENLGSSEGIGNKVLGWTAKLAGGVANFLSGLFGVRNQPNSIETHRDPMNSMNAAGAGLAANTPYTQPDQSTLQNTPTQSTSDMSSLMSQSGQSDTQV